MSFGHQVCREVGGGGSSLIVQVSLLFLIYYKHQHYFLGHFLRVFKKWSWRRGLKKYSDRKENK